MGKALRPEHVRFFHDRMTEHDRVTIVRAIASDLEYLFSVYRVDGLPMVHVHLSDAYEYGELDYLARPREIGHNSFVVLGLPHAQDVRAELVQRARSDGIGIGKIGKFMGALRMPDVWRYESPEERAQRQNMTTNYS